MAHPEQIEFCKTVQKLFPAMFRRKMVLDMGSLDINGNNQYLFDECLYVGVDIAEGQNVDIVSKGHELKLPDGSFDVVISTECFEHDRYYEDTINNIYRLLKPGGLFLFTCATVGRPEHGTRRSRSQDAPFLESYDTWADYYRNLTEQDVRSVLDVSNSFEKHEFSVNLHFCDLYFWGIKKGVFRLRDNYSVLSDNGLSKLVQQLNREKERLLSSRSWRLTKPLRAAAAYCRKQLS